jgi:hypothetical protein
MRNEDNQEQASSNQPVTPAADDNKSSGSLPCKSPTGSGLSPESAMPAVASSPEASAHYQHIREIQAMLKAGAYWIPAQKLAPILARIFFSMRRPGYPRHPIRQSEPEP